MEAFLSEHLPFWSALTDTEKQLVKERTTLQTMDVNRVMHLSGQDCTGVKLIRSGQVRIFITSSEGDEVNLYRLTEGEICVLSIISMQENLNLDLNVQAEQESLVYIIPCDVYKKLNKENPAVTDFTQEVLTRRLGMIMSKIGTVSFDSVSKRLADSLLSYIDRGKTLEIITTHENLAKDIGSSREVVSRLLKQFEERGILAVSRGKIRIQDLEKLIRTAQ